MIDRAISSKIESRIVKNSSSYRMSSPGGPVLRVLGEEASGSILGRTDLGNELFKFYLVRVIWVVFLEFSFFDIYYTRNSPFSPWPNAWLFMLRGRLEEVALR